MLMRTKAGGLLDVKLADFATDREYYKFILTLVQN
jgi:hypothetical protein